MAKKYIDCETLPEKKERGFFSEDEFNAGWNACLDAIASTPAADVAKVRHGRWLIKTIRGDKRTVCSECLSETGTCYEENYCHNCGAKMDKSEEENNA